MEQLVGDTKHYATTYNSLNFFVKHKLKSQDPDTQDTLNRLSAAIEFFKQRKDLYELLASKGSSDLYTKLKSFFDKYTMMEVLCDHIHSYSYIEQEEHEKIQKYIDFVDSHLTKD